MRPHLAQADRSTGNSTPPPQPLRVSLLSSLPPSKGISPYTVGLLRGLQAVPDLEVEVHAFKSLYPRWLYPGGSPAEEGFDEPVPFTRVSRRLTWYNPVSWLRCGFSLRGQVLHAQWWSPFLAPVYAVVMAIARLRGLRVLVTVHNVRPHERSRLHEWLMRAILRLGQHYIVHAPGDVATLTGAIGVQPDRIDVLPHGTLDVPAGPISRAEARRALGIPEADAPVILIFGNIRDYKGVDVLIEAFARVRQRLPAARLVIAGQPWVSWRPFEAAIARLNLESQVHEFLHFISTDEVHRLFLASDVVVLPYTAFHGQSGAGTLALSFAKPMVVSDVGGLPQLAADPGCVVPPGDPEALARALARVLTDSALRERLSEETGRIARRHGWEGIAASTAALYRKLAAAPAQESPETSLPVAVRPASDAARPVSPFVHHDRDVGS